MRWFFITFYTVTAILFLSFVAWIVTRTMHADEANYIVGKIRIYDLGAIAVVMCYVAFVGAWHTWERLTGRMELERHQAPPPPPDVRR
jgi:hypothetical protein